jgi:hypothetical protein
MIHSLETKNIGPIDDMKLDFGERLNIITGDNGLGKSFILDLAWYALSRRWVREINPKLLQGYQAQPRNKKEAATISFGLKSNKGNDLKYTSTFNAREQAWIGKAGRPYNAGLVLYAMADGSFAVWDSARNYWKQKGATDIQERQPAFIFSPAEIWEGLNSKDNIVLCNGLIRDLASWHKEKGSAYESLNSLLKQLSPTKGESLSLGGLTRISIDDVRDMPTIFSAGIETPVVFASSAVRRILALAYLLVWSVEEHKKASELLGEEAANLVTFMIDEIEAHLHPQWQRRIIPALIASFTSLMQKSHTQFIITTHSPLVLTSLEGIFDESEDSNIDAWFDLDFNAETKQAKLTQRRFAKMGSAAYWLTSPAFDLKTEYSVDKEELYIKLKEFLARNDQTQEEAIAIAQALDNKIGSTDPMWLDFIDLCEEKSWEV